ncbi:hypothetical protein KCU65_g8986, partial [Aureobasidium melanogenum]
MSVFTQTQQELSSDVLESPRYQNLEVCLQRYLTWLSRHEIGLALTLETSLLDGAVRVYQRLDRLVNCCPYELALDDYSYLQEQLVDMTVYCRRVSSPGLSRCLSVHLNSGFDHFVVVHFGFNVLRSICIHFNADHIINIVVDRIIINIVVNRTVINNNNNNNVAINNHKLTRLGGFV